jgi:glycosyltransferase involved in cell wall biosynthesis
MADGPIRILRVIARLNVGGPSLHVSYLSSDLDKLGYETTLAAGQVGPGEGSMEYVARERGVEPVFISSLQREVEPLADVAAVRHLLRLIREQRPHILHTHTAKAGAVGRVAALLAGDARPPVIVHTFHGHVLRGYFSSPLAAGFREIERRLARHTDALVAVSPEVRDDLVRLGVAPEKKIAVIRLGLDLDGRTHVDVTSRVREREALGIPPERFLVGWLGRFTEIKKVDDLIRAFALLRERGADAALALVGDGPSRAQMEALAEKLGIAADCHFVGYRKDVAPLFAAFDAVTLTSANEGTPVTLIEALAAGRPVVATDVGGVADVVRDGESGFLVPPGDVDQIADRLARLAGDEGLRRAFGERGRAYVLPRYSVPRLVDDVDTLYRSLLAVRAPSERRVIGPLSEPLGPALAPQALRRVPRAPRRLRIVLLSQYFPPEVGATQSRMQAFADYLAARGHKVTVVAEFPNHPLGVIPDRYRGHYVVEDRSNAYRVVRVWVKTSPVKNQQTRIAFYSSYMALAAAVGPALGRTDVVLATSPPLFTGVAGLAIARMNGAPLVLDVRDLWPAAADALEQMSRGWMSSAAETLEQTLYRRAAAVIAVTRPFCDHIDAIRGKPPRTELIPNGTLDLFFANGDGSSRSLPGLPQDGFVVTFAGTHGIAQALPSVVDAAALLDGTAHFAFVGEGPLKEQVVAKSEALGLGNVSFHPQVPMEQMPPLLAASDALLVPLSAHPVFADFVPSKMIDFMAAGKPVLLSAAGESARLLERSGAGVAVKPEDPEALAEAVRWLRAHPEAAESFGEHGRAFARKRLRSVQAERLEQVLLDVTRR